MSSRFAIAALIYSMIQGVLFGIGTVLVLATPLKEQAMTLMPVVVITTAILALPFSWWIAPRLRARYWRRRGERGDIISGPVDPATR
jgi:hypothetical protein